jgi:integrase
MSVTKRGSGFQASFMISGVRYRAQFPDVRSAEIWEDEVRLSLRKGLAAPPPRTASTPRRERHASLGAVFDYTASHIWAGSKSERDQVRNARYAVLHFGADTPIRSIGRVEIDAWVLALKQQRNSGGTINRKLAALSRMFRTAADIGVLQSKPSLPRQKETQGRERYLEPREVLAIIRTLRTWSKSDHADLVEFLVATGCRIGEALSLAWSDVRRGSVTVVGDKSKTSKTRHVPISQALVDVLNTRREMGTAGPFAAVTYQAFRHSFEKAVGHLGLEDVVVHTLRHTAASWLAMRGVDIYRIMRFMGHSSVKTTMRYAKLSPSSLNGLATILAEHTHGLEIVADLQGGDWAARSSPSIGP